MDDDRIIEHSHHPRLIGLEETPIDLDNNESLPLVLYPPQIPPIPHDVIDQVVPDTLSPYSSPLHAPYQVYQEYITHLLLLIYSIDLL